MMPFDLPLELPERTEYSDAYYAAVGRAVAFAVQFEGNVRALVAGLAAKKETAHKPALNMDELAQRLTKRWNRGLTQHAKDLADHFKLPWLHDVGSDRAWYSTMMSNAIEARNELAHAYSLGAEHEIETDAGRERKLAELREVVGKLAEANLLVGLMIHSFNKEQLPTTKYVDSYAQRVKSWVCDVD